MDERKLWGVGIFKREFEANLNRETFELEKGLARSLAQQKKRVSQTFPNFPSFSWAAKLTKINVHKKLMNGMIQIFLSLSLSWLGFSYVRCIFAGWCHCTVAPGKQMNESNGRTDKRAELFTLNDSRGHCAAGKFTQSDVTWNIRKMKDRAKSSSGQCYSDMICFLLDFPSFNYIKHGWT